jgi:hypothetical protein
MAMEREGVTDNYSHYPILLCFFCGFIGDYELQERDNDWPALSE